MGRSLLVWPNGTAPVDSTTPSVAAEISRAHTELIDHLQPESASCLLDKWNYTNYVAGSVTNTWGSWVGMGLALQPPTDDYRSTANRCWGRDLRMKRPIRTARQPWDRGGWR